MIEHLLLESPWTLAISLAAIAAVVFLVGGRSGHRNTQKWAALPLLLAVVGFTVAEVVNTDRERMVQKTERLVEAAVADPIDLDTMGSLLDESVLLFNLDREAILAMAKRARNIYRIDSATITLLLARRDTPTAGQTLLTALTRVSSKYGDYPAKTRWLIHWRKDPAAGWIINRLELIAVNDQPARQSILP
ncbi:hypothetical protein HED60_11590 [Planctomycetales bacterium ZRK34]|nr:hypothetical protein HED60_11590 [Planctomycetales bacterium ZRK34]